MSEISKVVQRQRDFFSSHQTQDINFRISQLKRLKNAVLEYEEKIMWALFMDLHKPEAEAFTAEIGLCLGYINQVLKNIRKWTRPQKAKGIKLFPFTKGAVIYEPLGISLIMAPWNFPLNLTLGPLIYSIAAGNCAVLKPSRTSVHVNMLIQNLIRNTFDEEYVSVTTQSNQEILSERFDHICFTGGSKIGRKVMEAASKSLTPVLLELGGKCPCVVHQDADLEKTSSRVASGKFFNAGQTCIAPDYILVQKGVKDDLVQQIKNKIIRFYGPDPKKSTDYGRIINIENLKRLLSYLEGVRVLHGGQYDMNGCYLAPTLVDQIPDNARLMREEIFGPILPILEYDDIDEAIAFINQRNKPLALYFFTNSKTIQNRLIFETSSGGVTINDTLLHFTASDLPFGGVGESGFGRYHGFAGFSAFSNERSILKQSILFDLPIRYPPTKSIGLKLIKILSRY